MAREAKKRPEGVEELLDDCETSAEDLMECLERLREFSRPSLERLPDRRLYERGEDFLQGLLSNLGRKSPEPIAECVGKDRFPLQYFMGESPWDHGPLLDELCRQVADQVGEPHGILGIDPSAFPKKGTESVGVARQWCGRLGKIDNGPGGVFLGYVSNRGHTLIDERLYLPKSWARDPAGRGKCRVPKGVRSRTAMQSAVELLRERGSQLPHGWIVADDEFGRPWRFRQKLRQRGERSVLDVPANTLIRDLQAPAPKRRHKRGRAPKVKVVPGRTGQGPLAAQRGERIEIRVAPKGRWGSWPRARGRRQKDRRKRSAWS